MKKYTVTLSEKELFILWSIACWFNEPVTSTLKFKLAGLAYSKKRKELEKRYANKILKRFVSVAESVAKHPEWLEDSK